MASFGSNAQHGLETAGLPCRVVVWLRNDLRTQDNPLLHEASRLCAGAKGQQKYDEVLPVYVFDPRTYGVMKTGDLKTGVFRAEFLVQSVRDLKARLRSLASDLLVLTGKPEDVIPGLVQGCSSPLVLCSQEVTSEELKVEAAVERALKPLRGRLVRMWSNTMYHLDDLQGPQGPFGSKGIKGMPDGFTSFREKVEKGSQVRPALPAPSKGTLAMPPSTSLVRLPPQTLADRSQDSGSAGQGLVSLGTLLQAEPSFESLPWPENHRPQPAATHPQVVLKFQGGETAAMARLHYYLWDSDLLATYFDTRNGMLGGDYSTKFAPWLAAGCISPRAILHDIKKYEAQRVANKSTYWVVFELIWRDFFRFFAAKHENRIFFETGPIGKNLPWVNDPKRLQCWIEGKTGLPLVDANMRELAATGFMSNRGRQNVASHLVLDLGIDWRRGACYFESLLLDYDVTSNWGNWVAAAGLTGGRINAFNITKQSKDYDLNGDYIRAWLPELKHVPAARIHEPWLMSKEEMKQYGVEIGVDYPAPMPAKDYARLQYAGSSGGGGYSGRGGPNNRGGGGSSSNQRGRTQSGQPKRSQFEMFA